MRAHRQITTVSVIAGVMLAAGPTAAQAGTDTQHDIVQFSESFVGPCDGSVGLITVQGSETIHVTDNGRTFQVISNLHGTFSFDPDDPGLETVSGHFVSLHQENVNYAELKDWRVTDSIHSVGSTNDGRSVPVMSTLTVLYAADGGTAVKIDRVRCGGQLVE